MLGINKRTLNTELGKVGLVGGVTAIPHNNTIPDGYLECNGATISRVTYEKLFAEIGTLFGAGDGSTTFKIPDFRGEFLRGFDNGRGADSGRSIGSFQDSDNKSHSHTVQSGAGTQSASGVYAYTSSTTTGWGPLSMTSTGGTESRPRNYAVKYLIKY